MKGADMNLDHRVSYLGVGIVALALAPIACSSAGQEGTGSLEQESTSTAEQAVTTLSITGEVTDAHGAPLAGVAVRLGGRSQGSATTAADGTYAFNGLVAGSYSVLPSLAGCNFDPNVENLNNLVANTVANFDGSGASCGGAAENQGAKNGTLTISGTITNAAHAPLAGAAVTLRGSTQAVRTTTASGTYSFSVNPGSYSLSAAFDGCAFTPSVVNENNLTASIVVNISGAGGACAAAVVDAGVTVDAAVADAAVASAASPR